MSNYCCFKFRSINKNLIDSLIRSCLYFAPRYRLNDPFDSSVDITRAIETAIDLSSASNKLGLLSLRDDPDFVDRFNKAVDGIGICSFSLTLKETLMWSHYADDHRGLALRYDFPMSYLNDEDRFLGVSKAHYESNRVSSWLTENSKDSALDHQGFVMSLLKILLTSKAPAWEYEEESRLFRTETGSFEVPRSMLRSIIFGLRTSPEDIELIRSIVSSYYEEVTFGQATRTEDDFGIDFEEL